MAYNPFTWFRKNQKVVLVVVTIVTMVTFIFSFGQGDLFQQLLRVIGASGQKGEYVTTLYGKKIHDRDLAELAQQRKMANDFLYQMTSEGHASILRDLEREREKEDQADPLFGLKAIIMRAKSRTQRIQGLARFVGNPNPQFRQFIDQQVNSAVDEVNEDLRRLSDRSRLALGKDDEQENFARLQNLAVILGYQQWSIPRANQVFQFVQGRFAVSRPPSDFYFGGSVKPDDLLDFMVWKGQADKLGITLTEADVMKEIMRESAGYELWEGKSKSFDRQKKVTDFLNQPIYRNKKPADLLNALKEEFRIAMAQGFLMGGEPGVRAYRLQTGAASTPSVVTPDEFLRFYREQRTTLRVRFLQVRAEDFLKQAKSGRRPTEEELQLLFDQGRAEEPRPTLRTPAFKRPRRIAVEYVMAKLDNPQYKTQSAARTRARLLTPFAGIYAARAAAPPAGCPLAAVVGVLTPLLLDPVQEEYKKYLEKEHHSWIQSGADASLHDENARKTHLSSYLDKATVRNMFAGLTQGIQIGNPLLGLTALQGTATVHEARGASIMTLMMMAAPVDVHLLLPNMCVCAAAMARPLSPAEYLPFQMPQIEERQLSEIVTGNLTKMKEELAKLVKKPQQQPDASTRRKLAAYIKKAVADYHLTLYRMTEPESGVELMEFLEGRGDPKKVAAIKATLGPIKDASVGRDKALKVTQLLNELFAGQGVYEANDLPGTLDQKRVMFLYWRTEDLQPQTLSFTSAKSQVTEAFYFDQARQLASKEAERLVTHINKKDWPPGVAVSFLRGEQKQGALFELDGIAQLVPPREAQARVTTNYLPYTVPDDKLSMMPYAPADLAKQLLALKKPGQAKVVVDLPAKNFYVAVLEERAEPTLAQFKRQFSREWMEAVLYKRFLRDRAVEFRKAIIEQLRKEASGNKVDKQGRLDIPESVRKRETGRFDDD